MDLSQFFSYSDWKGPAFELFGPAHLTAMGFFVVLNILFIAFRSQISPRWDKIFRYTMAALLVVDEIAWHVWNWVNGNWNIQTMLPLYLCSVFVWVGAYMLVTKNYTIYEFIYLLGIPAALQALLTPDAGRFGFPHYRFFQVMLSHGLIITSALYMSFVARYRPTWASVFKVLFYSNIYAVVIFFFNYLIGSNYLFLAHKLDTASLLDVLPPWPYYLIFIEGLGVAFVLLFYAPFAIWDVFKRKAARLVNTRTAQ
jgi:hypothetical integral membrane protein (TIGR02206 family)